MDGLIFNPNFHLHSLRQQNFLQPIKCNRVRYQKSTIPSIVELLNSEYRAKVINKLHEVFKTTGTRDIKLPQIVVVGSQSCGKSSVLESLVGKSFLPRGIEIVTRCPIVLQLNHHKASELDEDDANEFCVFANEPDKKYTDFNDVQKEIERQTDKLAGSGKGITSQPIILKVTSPKVLSLTVVDLPGITKVPVKGQPVNIEEIVTKLILEYIENKETLILAVSAAHDDIANSESIKLAKSVDPDGSRTLAIITKLDLMDKGTDAYKMLNGESGIEVKLGIIGVKNRSQEDIKNSIPIEEALENEKKFLEDRYPTLAAQNGTPYLAKRLNSLLLEHIKRCLPDLEKRITCLLRKHDKTLKTLGPELLDEHKALRMIESLRDFNDNYTKLIEGPSNKDSKSYGSFGSRIAHVFQKTFVPNLLAIKPDFPEGKILSALKNATSMDCVVSLEDAFKTLTKEEIQEMMSECMNCADEAKLILNNAITTALEDQCYSALSAEVTRIANKLMQENLDRARDKIKEHFEILSSSVYSADHGFNRKLFGPILSQAKVKSDSENLDKDLEDVSPKLGFQALPLMNSNALATGNKHDKDICQYVKTLATSYFTNVQKELTNFIPKLVPYYLYYAPVKDLYSELYKQISPKVDKLMIESPDVIRERDRSQQMIKVLQNAMEVISEIDDTMR